MSFLKTNQITEASLASLVVLSLLMVSFLLFEPRVGIGQEEEEFTVQLQVTEELAFVTPPTDVSLSPSVSGLTGGTANGSTTFVIRSNNSAGYNVTIEFASTTAMLGDAQGAFIANYEPASPGTPDYNFITPSGTHAFGYTIEAVEALDVAQLFRNSGSTCNTGSANDVDQCWYNVANAETPVTVIDRGSATPSSGATSTLKFRVELDANPSPAVPNDFYTATATLTATEN